MRTYIYTFYLVVSFNSFAQKSVYVKDSLTNEIITSAIILDENNKTLALTNDQGFFLDKKFTNVKLAHFAYKTKKIDFFSKDTVYLTPKIQELQEIKISHITPKVLYNKTINLSTDNQYKKSYTTIGKYFESIVIVYLDTKDTVVITKIADLKIDAQLVKSNYDYNFYLKNGGKLIRCTNEKHDTTNFSNIEAMTAKFSSLLNYDLTNKKKFNLDDFDFKASNNGTNKVVFSKKDKEINSEGFIYYFNDTLLNNWTSSFKSSKKFNNEKIYSNIDEGYKNILFEFKDNKLQLSNLLTQSKLTANIIDKLFEIYSVKGFYVDNTVDSKFDESMKYKSVESYFKNDLTKENFDQVYKLPLLLR